MDEERLMLVDPLLIDANPFQPASRVAFTPEQLVDLEDVRERGLLQPFRVRSHPEGNGRYQQHFGHRRLAAWLVFRPGESIPVFIQEADDRAMFEAMVAENADRLDPSAIEKALTLHAYIEQFGGSQVEAGKLFNLRTQGAVSNLLGLLRLPAEMRELMQQGLLPERIARALKSLAQVDAKAAIAAAKAIAKAEPDERDGELYAQLEHYVDGHGYHLRWVPWKSLDWPRQPIETGNQHVPTVPACTGCPFNVRCDSQDKQDRGCVRKQCYKLKLVAWSEVEAQRVAKEHGISVAQKGEKVSVVFDGRNWGKVEKARRMLATKHESLRTVPATDTDRTHYRSTVSGSDFVSIGSTDLPALRKAMRTAAPEAKPKPEHRVLEAWEKRAKAQEAAKRERAKQVRTLLSNAAPAFAPVIPVVLQELLYREFRFDLSGRTSGEKDRAWKKASVDERGALIAGALLKKHVGLAPWSVPSVDAATQKVTALAKAARVKLPRGWDSALSANSKPQTPKSKGAKAKRKKP